MKQTQLFKIARVLFFAVIFWGIITSAVTMVYAIKHDNNAAYFFGYAAICISATIFLIFKNKFIK